MPAYPRRLNARIHAPTECPRQFAVATVSEIDPHQPLRDSFPPRGSLKTYTTTPNTCPRWLTAAPAHLPMAARHREIPCKRNENKRTRQPQILARGGSPPCPWRLATLPAVVYQRKTSPRKERFSGVCNISFSRFYLILPFFILPHVARAGKYERSDLAAAINNYRTFAERTPAGARKPDRLPEPTYPYARNRS